MSKPSDKEPTAPEKTKTETKETPEVKKEAPEEVVVQYPDVASRQNYQK